MSSNEPTTDVFGSDPRVPELSGARIVFVMPELELGGAERQALLLSEYLSGEQGAEVEFWALGGEPGRVAQICEQRGTPWRIVPVPWFTSRREKARGLARLAWALRRARPDIISSYLIVPNVACGLVWRATGARFFIWNQRDHGLGRLGPGAERRAIRQTPLFISNSEHGADFLTRTLGAPAERVHVIHNGIRLAPPQASRTTWRSRMGIGEDAVAACMVANLTRYKDHETLLRAWRRVLDSPRLAGRPAVLVLAGRVGDPDNTHHRVKAAAFDLELGRSVRFLGEVRDVSGLLGAVDLGVFSSRSESSPNGVLECMAAGLAVAATDNPGVRAAVGTGGHQLLAPPGDADALAERILRLMTDAPLRAELGAANRLRVANEFSPRVMCERTAALMAGGLRGAARAPRPSRGAAREQGRAPSYER